MRHFDEIMDWYMDQSLWKRVLFFLPLALVSVGVVVILIAQSVAEKRSRSPEAARTSAALSAARALDEKTEEALDALRDEDEITTKDIDIERIREGDAHERIDAARSFDAVDRIRRGERDR